jgi:hypothetical protein
MGMSACPPQADPICGLQLVKSPAASPPHPRSVQPSFCGGYAPPKTSYFVRLRSRLSTLPVGIIVPALPQRSPPRRLTAAACGGLGSATDQRPDRRTRRAYFHVQYSYAAPFGALERRYS